MEQEREWLDEKLAERGETAARDSEWRHLGPPIITINGPDDADYVAKAIHEIREGGRRKSRVRRAEPADPPAEVGTFESASWDAYRRRLFARHEVGARMARGLFGLAGPLAPEAVADFLRKAREQERRRGDVMRLEVPVIQGERVEVEEWEVYRGHEADALGDRELPQPLGFLAGRAAQVASSTGTRQADAVLYLLSDVVVWWPPAHTHVEWSPRFSVVMRVEWPFFAPKGVAELYTRTVGSLYGLRTDAPVADRLAVGRRAMSAELTHFAGGRRAQRETWASIYAAWEIAYPDKHFSSALSLRRTCLEADKRFPDMSLSLAPWRPSP